MSQNSRLNGLSSLPATGVPLGGNIRKPVLARETRREALGERSLETVRAQRGSVRVFGNELHDKLCFDELGVAVDEGGQSFVKSGGRENLPHANLSLRKRSGTDLCRRIFPARYSRTLR